MATTYVTPSSGWAAYALQARTDEAGAGVDDVTGEDLRLMASLFSGGVVGANSFRVTERGAGANMSVDVGSGNAASDLAVIAGTSAGQGNYVVRLGNAVVNVPLNASNVSNPRIDEIYLAVQDDPYDSSSRVVPRLAYRDGTPAAFPAAPGPDGAWDAFLLIASVLVGAGVTSIVDANITDERAWASPLLPSNPVLSELQGYVYVFSASVTGTDGTKATVPMSIPADWREYSLTATASAVLFSASNPNAHESNLRLRLGGVDSDPQDAGAGGDSAYPTVIAHRTGLTTTGSITPNLRAVRTGTINGTLTNIMMHVRAVRTA